MRDNIVFPAWRVASESSTIKKFNFFPSLLATLYLSFIVLYQVAWSYVYIFQLKDEFFSLVIDFVHATYFVETVVTVIVFFLLYLFTTPIAEAGLVSMVAKRDSGEPWQSPYFRAISIGLKNFLPIFEAHNLLAPFKLLSIVTFYLFSLRIFGKEYAVAISVIAALYLVFSIFVGALFAYTRFFIVFQDMRALPAMVASLRMALDNLGVTFRLYYTLVLVYVRTLLTVAAFIVFPFAISAILTYVTIAAVKFVAFAVIGIMIVAFLGFVSHVNSVLEIFVEALWYRAFTEHSKTVPVHGHDDHGGNGARNSDDPHGH